MKKLLLAALFLVFSLAGAEDSKNEEIIKALEVLQKGKWVDLTHAVHEEIPRFGTFSKLQKNELYNVKNDGFFVYKNTFVTQYGTHIDVPIHFVENKRSLEQIELKELVLPLVVINKEKEVEKNPDFILSKKDILEWEKINGQIPKDSFVAFASGWSKRWGKMDFNNKDSKGVPHTPGWSVEALEYVLNERGAMAIGHETFNTDASKDEIKNKFFVAEKFVLAQDKYQLELLNNLTSLPAKGGIIIIGVPKFAGYPGFPVRAFAIVPQ